MSHTVSRLVEREVAEHIKSFWEKRMLAQIYAHSLAIVLHQLQIAGGHSIVPNEMVRQKFQQIALIGRV